MSRHPNLIPKRNSGSDLSCNPGCNLGRNVDCKLSCDLDCNPGFDSGHALAFDWSRPEDFLTAQQRLDLIADLLISMALGREAEIPARITESI